MPRRIPALLLALLCLPAVAQETNRDATFDQLLADVQTQTGDPLSTADALRQNERDIATLLSSINAAAAAYSAPLSPDARRRFERSQSAWDAHATALCAAEADREESGSLAAVQETACQVREARGRLAWLSDGASGR